MDFEQQLQKNLFAQKSEKTFSDKVLAKSDVDSLRELVKKDGLSREDMLEILYLLSSTESKLLNYDSYNRYIILKYFVWVREFVKCAELMYDYRDFLQKSNIKLTKRTKKALDNNQKLMEHNIKFLVDLYLNIARTSLSLNAKAFDDLIQNKYDISYTYPNQQQIQQEKRSIFSLRR